MEDELVAEILRQGAPSPALLADMRRRMAEVANAGRCEPPKPRHDEGDHP